MSKLTRVKSDKYVTVSNRVTQDPNISLKARGLLFTIMTLSPDWDFTVRGLVTITKEGKAAIYSAIDELIEAGYCERHAVRAADGKILHHDYTFYENADRVSAREPLSGFQELDNQEVENPPQYKKSKEYKKNKNIAVPTALGDNHVAEKPDHSRLMEHHALRIGKIPDGGSQGMAIKWLLSAYTADECIRCYNDQVRDKFPTHVSWQTVKKYIGEWKATRCQTAEQYQAEFRRAILPCIP